MLHNDIAVAVQTKFMLMFLKLLLPWTGCFLMRWSVTPPCKGVNTLELWGIIQVWKAITTYLPYLLDRNIVQPNPDMINLHILLPSEAPIVTTLYLCNMREMSPEICLSSRKRNVTPLTTTSNYPDCVRGFICMCSGDQWKWVRWQKDGAIKQRCTACWDWLWARNEGLFSRSATGCGSFTCTISLHCWNTSSLLQSVWRTKHLHWIFNQFDSK